MEDPSKNLKSKPEANALAHWGELVGWLKHRFPSVSDAEDIVQEAYSRLIRSQETGPIFNPRAFLFVTARNLALNAIRRAGYEKRSPMVADSYTETSETLIPSPHHMACSNEAIALLMQAIQELSPRCRQVITLRKIYGLSHREIADQMGISINTVKVQGAIGVNKCREFFQRKGLLNTDLI
jgi:RNA polymerase sigma factor (sigma-70 family)